MPAHRALLYKASVLLCHCSFHTSCQPFVKRHSPSSQVSKLPALSLMSVPAWGASAQFISSRYCSVRCLVNRCSRRYSRRVHSISFLPDSSIFHLQKRPLPSHGSKTMLSMHFCRLKLPKSSVSHESCWCSVKYTALKSFACHDMWRLGSFIVQKLGDPLGSAVLGCYSYF